MLRSILLVLDGQSADHGSVSLGLRLASDFDALLVGLGVIDEAVVHPLEPVPIGAGQAKRELDAARLHEQQVLIGGTLSAVALRCAHSQVAFKPLEHVGSPAEDIAVEAQRYDMVLLPRPSNDQRNPAEPGISDALRTILHSTPRPVVAAPDTVPVGDAIVVAYDGSLQAARTLHAFVSTGLAAKHPVHVVTVHDDPVQAARRGNRAAEFLAFHRIGAALCVVKGEHPAEQILALAEQVKAGMIVMGAYGKRRLREFFLGSVTRTLMAESPIPLFLYH